MRLVAPRSQVSSGSSINSGDFDKALDEGRRILAFEYLSALHDSNARIPTYGSRSEHAIENRSVDFHITSGGISQSRYLMCACCTDYAAENIKTMHLISDVNFVRLSNAPVLLRATLM